MMPVRTPDRNCRYWPRSGDRFQSPELLSSCSASRSLQRGLRNLEVYIWTQLSRIRTFDLCRPVRNTEGVEISIVRSNVKHSVSNHWRSIDDRRCLEAPQIRPGKSVESVDGVVVAAHVNYPVRHCRRRNHAGISSKGPSADARAGARAIDTVIKATIEHATTESKGVRRKTARPAFLASNRVHRFSREIGRPVGIDHALSHRGCARHAHKRFIPDQGSGSGIDGVEPIVPGYVYGSIRHRWGGLRN